VEKPVLADLADHLTSADPLSRADQIAGGMVQGGLHAYAVNAAMAEKKPVAVRRTEVNPGHDSGIRCTYCSPARGAEVSAIVQLPDLEQGMQPHPKSRRHRARNGVAKPMTACRPG
jgi:hypothetical protein